MLKYFLFCLICSYSLNGFSQNKYYSDEYLDSLIGTEILIKKNYKNKSLSEIAQDLKIDGNKELQYAILAKWVVNHLNYDIRSEHISIKDALNQKRGVCRHYAVFMDSLAKYLGFKSYYISGYTKKITNNKLSFEHHAWNAVEIDEKVLMSDITWSDGNNAKKSTNSSLGGIYFLMKPDDFIQSHYPRQKKFKYSKYSTYKFKRSPIISNGYYTLDKYFSINLKKIKLYNKQRDLQISLKALNDSIEIKKIELIKWDKNNESDYFIEFDKKINLKKKETIYYLNASNVDIKKDQHVSIAVEFERNDSNKGVIKYYMSIIDFFW